MASWPLAHHPLPLLLLLGVANVPAAKRSLPAWRTRGLPTGRKNPRSVILRGCGEPFFVEPTDIQKWHLPILYDCAPTWYDHSYSLIRTTLCTNALAHAWGASSCRHWLHWPFIKRNPGSLCCRVAMLQWAPSPRCQSLCTRASCPGRHWWICWNLAWWKCRNLALTCMGVYEWRSRT